jgi:hypothetical protein
MAEAFPTWTYYPLNLPAPEWVRDFVSVVADARDAISTSTTRPVRLDSNGVLAEIAPGLSGLGYTVETSKAKASKIKRPVLFGENGKPTVLYEVDAVHDDLGVVVEVEAGRGARGNATYRDLIRTSLIVDARFLALLLPVAYTYGVKETTGLPRLWLTVVVGQAASSLL